MCTTSIFEARNNFSALVKSAEEGEVVALTRYDKPVAVLLSYADYESKSAKEKDWLSEWRLSHADELDDIGLEVTPSRECPDPNRNPWD
ncbi:MAG: type II toxin-antitoxin system Phd/YefM family antitoxin [Treponema sp.]|nr:type II toxin-antitoxin system Phd/YefM family antitoxin [Treponema sp.]